MVRNYLISEILRVKLSKNDTFLKTLKENASLPTIRG